MVIITLVLQGTTKGCLGKSPTISQQKIWEKRVTGGGLRLCSKSCRCVEQRGDSSQRVTTGQLQISSQRAEGRVYTIKLGSSLVEKYLYGARKVAPWLKVLAALAEDQCAVPSTHKMAYNHP